MKNIGFPISLKENEKRRAITPDDLCNIRNTSHLYFEFGYGEVLGYSDIEYEKYGCSFCSKEEVLSKDVICDPKIGDADYLKDIKNQTIFGWVHAVQNRDVTDILINNNITAYAWEDMNEDGRHIFWRNNEIAGEAAISHAYLLHGVFPYQTKVAVIGNGNIARGALKILNYMGADIIVYNRKTEKLLRKEIDNYDVIVNAVMWDTSREDHIIFKEDLKLMKKGSMIIDISCDRSGAIETSIPTTINDPIYVIGGITHYVVDHTPALYYKTTTQSLSKEVCKYLDFLIEDTQKSCIVLEDSLIIYKGNIIDQKIVKFQNR